MKRGAYKVVWLAGTLVLGLATCRIVAETTSTTSNSNPYSGIVERNVFNLKDPPLPPTNTVAPVPVPNVILTGITTILGNKRALLKWPSPPTPGQPAKDTNCVLAEGQSQDDVEVLEIDEKTDTVRIKNHGQFQTLNFSNNGAKLVAQAMPVGTQPQMPQIPQPVPGMPTPPPGVPVNPNVIPPPAPGNPAGVAIPAGPGAAAAGRQIPSRTLRLPPIPGGTPGGAPISPQTVSPK